MSNFAKLSREFQTKDILWTEKYLSRTPFYAGYWVRKRLDDAIAEHAKLAHGILLDVGCGVKPYEHLLVPFVEKYIGIEYSPESGYRGNKADLCGDASALPLADASIDTILCTEVMEHLADPEKTISEFVRVLRPGGTLVTTAPFVYPIHDANGFFRYSPDGLAAMMTRQGLAIDGVKPLAGTAITLAAMFNLYWYDEGFIWTKWLYPFGVIFRPVLWLSCFVVNMLGGLSRLFFRQMSFNYLTIAKKNEAN